jgi:hypothetical protein
MRKCPPGPPVPAFVNGSAHRVTGMSPFAAQWRPTCSFSAGIARVALARTSSLVPGSGWSKVQRMGERNS